MRKTNRTPLFILVATLIAVVLAVVFLRHSPTPRTETIDELYSDARAGKVISATLVDKSNVVQVVEKSDLGAKITVHYPELASPNVMAELIKDDVKVDAKTHRDSFVLSTLLVTPGSP